MVHIICEHCNEVFEVKGSNRFIWCKKCYELYRDVVVYKCKCKGCGGVYWSVKKGDNGWCCEECKK